MTTETSQMSLASLADMSKDDESVEFLADWLYSIVDGGIMDENDTENQRIAIAALARVLNETIEQYDAAREKAGAAA